MHHQKFSLTEFASSDADRSLDVLLTGSLNLLHIHSESACSPLAQHPKAERVWVQSFCSQAKWGHPGYSMMSKNNAEKQLNDYALRCKSKIVMVTSSKYGMGLVPGSPAFRSFGVGAIPFERQHYFRKFVVELRIRLWWHYYKYNSVVVNTSCWARGRALIVGPWQCGKLGTIGCNGWLMLQGSSEWLD